MTTAVKRRKLVDYMQTADDKKVKAIYALVENDIEEISDGDKEFIEELDRRTASFLDGSAKMYSLEEAKKIAWERVKAKRL